MTVDPHGHFRELAAGFAAHALEPDEEQTFRAHQLGCRSCRDDVVTHRETLAELASLLPAAPAVGLREAVIDSIRAEQSPMPLGEPRRPWPRTSWLGAAAAGAAALALLGTTVEMRGAARDARSELASLRSVVECSPPRCHASWLASSDDSRHAVLLDAGRDVRLVVDALPRNDRPREVYVLWRQSPDGTLSAVQAFHVSSSEAQTIRVTGIVRPYQGFAVSREPGGRLPRRPSAPVLLPSPAS